MTSRAPAQSAAELFRELVRIPSPSQREGAMASFIGDRLTRGGIPFVVDQSAAATGSETGNVIARVRHSPDRPTVLLVAHMDTVQTEGCAIEPVLGADGVIRSAGDTILGADNKSAVAALLTVLAAPREDHANVVAVFTTCEERGVMGASQLAALASEVDLAFPLDGSRPVGTVFEAAFGQTPFDMHVTGHEAHAARYPAEGVHALRVACEVVAGLELGNRGDTVVNVGSIRGGSETNVVPGFVEVLGEVRGYSTRAMDARFEQLEALAADIAARAGASIRIVRRPHDGAPPFSHTGDPLCAAIAAAAAADMGLQLATVRCAETLEANFLQALGIPTLGIASGGRHPHSVKESIPAAEIDRLATFVDAVLRRANQVAAGAASTRSSSVSAARPT